MRLLSSRRCCELLSKHQNGIADGAAQAGDLTVPGSINSRAVDIEIAYDEDKTEPSIYQVSTPKVPMLSLRDRIDDYRLGSAEYSTSRMGNPVV